MPPLSRNRPPPVQKIAPLVQKIAPPVQNRPPPRLEHTPPCPGTAPPVENIPPLSDQLRGDLCTLWALGFCDTLKGKLVEDEDTIPSEMVEPLVKLAEACIDGAASVIAQMFIENPDTTATVIYQAGAEACRTMRAINQPIVVSLN